MSKFSMTTLLKRLVAYPVAVIALQLGTAWAQEAPDALVKRVSEEILAIAKTDKQVQAGNQERIMEVVRAKILPHINFQRMTQLTAGRYWREATPEQQQALTNEFRTLLVYTYAGAVAPTIPRLRFVPQ
jgi:phospholipid transport system substrate-binding protein